MDGSQRMLRFALLVARAIDVARGESGN